MPEGIPVSYVHEKIEQGDYIAGQIDNALSVALIFGLFQSGFQGTAIFTAEEEIGKSWKHLGSFMHAREIETKRLIVLDTSPYETSDNADAGKIVLRNRDAFGTFNVELVEDLKATCETLGHEYDMKDETLITLGKSEQQIGRTELCLLYTSPSPRDS